MTSVLIDCGVWVAAVTLLAMLLRYLFTGKRWRLAAMFLAYICVIGGFGHIYQYVYGVDTTHFTFASDVLRTRREELAIGRRFDSERINRLEIAFDNLADEVAKGSAKISPSERNDTFVHVTCTRFTFDFTFNPNWTTDSEQNLVRHGRVVIRDDSGIVLGSEPADVPGPNTALVPQTTRDSDKLFESIYPITTAKSLSPVVTKIRGYLTSTRQKLDPAQIDQGPALPEDWTYRDFLYFSVITQTTVGYGDILPTAVWCGPVSWCKYCSVF